MGLRHAAMMAGMALGLMSGAAKAAYVLDINQVGANVVVTGSGSIDLSAATYKGSNFYDASLYPLRVDITTGSGFVDYYDIALDGPSSIGTGLGRRADITTGLPVNILVGSNELAVPMGYISDTQVGTSTSTFVDNTLADFGLTSGDSFTYLFQGRGESYDVFSINIGVVNPVPLPASAPMFAAALLGLAGLGLAAQRKKGSAAA